MNNSKQRNLILKIINESYDHPTAYQIHERAKKEMPNISLGTIYRNIHILVENKLINSIKDFNMERFDKKDDDHIHFICEICNEIFDIELKTDINIQVDDKFQITSHKINLKGLCPSCRKGE